MIKYFCFILFLFVNIFAEGQDIHKVTFKLNDVEISKNLLKETNLNDTLERIYGSVESYDINWNSKKIIFTKTNAFLMSLHYSFAQHRPLVLSPDMFWLLIIQGFSNHIKQNSDSLQLKIVNFQGKRKIDVKRNEFIKGNANNDWESVFSQFSDSIKNHINEELYRVLIPTFSTTGISEKIAFEITMMHTLEGYFIYNMYTFCGIPEITLEGSPEDWEKLKTNTNYLKKYGLEMWIDKLNPIIDKIIATSKGNIDKEFWNSIYKWDNGSGGPFISGWIKYFFPYIKDNNKKIQNPLIFQNFSNRNWLVSSNIPNGISEVKFNWVYQPNSTIPEIIYKMKFVAGFMGIEQDSLTFSLNPVISWAVSDSINKDFNRHDMTGSINSNFIYTNNYIFDDLHYKAQYPGGILAFRKYLNDNIKLSKEQTDKYRKIKLKCVIFKSGKIGNIDVIESFSKTYIEKVKMLLSKTDFGSGYHNSSFADGNFLKIS